MGIVNREHGIVPVAQLAYGRKGGNLALHAEHAIRHDEPMSIALRLPERVLEGVHVHVPVDVALGLAQADSVDDRRVVELVADQSVLVREETPEQPAVGVPAGRVRYGSLGLEEISDAVFQLAMDVPRSADEAHGCRACPVPGSSVSYRFDHLGDVTQADVVVRAQVHGLAELFELHDRSLHSHDMEEALVNALFLHYGQLAGQSAVQAFVYRAPRYVRFLIEDHLTPPLIQSSL